MRRFTLTHNGNEDTIQEPKGVSEGITSVLKRDRKVHGVFFEFTDDTIDLEFGCSESREILHNAYSTAGVDAEVLFTIYDGNTVEFSGNIDFTEAEFGQMFYSMPVQVVNILKNIKNRKETDVSLSRTESLDGEAIGSIGFEQIALRSKTIEKIARWQWNPDIPGDNMRGFYDIDNIEENRREYVFQVLHDWQLDVRGFEDLFVYNEIVKTAAATNKFFNLEVKEGGLYKFKWHIKENIWTTVTPLHERFQEGSNFAIEVYDNEGNQRFKNKYNQKSVDQGQVSTVIYDAVRDGEDEFELNKGDEIYFYTDITVPVKGQQDVKDSSGLDGANIEATVSIVDDVSFVEITGLTREDPSITNGYKIHEAINKSLEIITSKQDVLRSDFFGRTDLGYSSNGCGSKLLITNGYRIRNFSDREIHTNFEDMINALSLHYNIGYGLEYVSNDVKVRVEQWEYFYGIDEIIHLDKPGDYREITDTDYIYNKVNFKFKDYANDEEEEGTIDDVHTEHTYSTPIGSVDNALDIESEYILSAFLIEFTRRVQFSEKPTESYKYDDDKFLINYQDGILDFGTLGQFVYFENSANNTITVRDADLRFLQEDMILSTPGNPVVKRVKYNSETNDTIIELKTDLQFDGVSNSEIGVKNILEPNTTSDYTSATGVVDPDNYYNLKMTLKRAMLAWGSYINSFLAYKLNTTKMLNTFAKINGELQTELLSISDCTLGDNPVQPRKENEDETLNNIAGGKRVFDPVLIKFRHGLCLEDIEKIKKAHQNELTGIESTQNYGYISVVDNQGVSKKGYLIEMKYNHIEQVADFTLLMKHEDFSEQFSQQFG